MKTPTIVPILQERLQRLKQNESNKKSIMPLMIDTKEAKQDKNGIHDQAKEKKQKEALKEMKT